MGTALEGREVGELNAAGGGGVDVAKRLGEGRVPRLLRIYELIHKSP